MTKDKVQLELLNKLNFSPAHINKLQLFHDELLKFNQKYNLISKSTENDIWKRHILDSAQLVRYIGFEDGKSLADMGSGAGFPGVVLALFNKNDNFHVKLYEKSPVKRDFLHLITEKLDIKLKISDNVYESQIEADIIVCRAFKKLDQIIKISREIVKKPHKILILKGKNAQDEINNVSLGPNYSYKLEKSITDFDSKIIIIEAK